MFDSIRVGGGNHSHSHSHSTTVNEHRATTDESIRILNEMQAKVQQNIIKSWRIDQNELKAVAIIFQDQRTSVLDQYIFRAKFTLNNKPQEFEIVMSHAEYTSCEIVIDGVPLPGILIQKFCEALTVQLFKVTTNQKDLLSKINWSRYL